jgi:hypothetical protein
MHDLPPSLTYSLAAQRCIANMSTRLNGRERCDQCNTALVSTSGPLALDLKNTVLFVAAKAARSPQESNEVLRCCPKWGPRPTAAYVFFLGRLLQSDSRADLGTNNKKSILFHAQASGKFQLTVPHGIAANLLVPFRAGSNQVRREGYKCCHHAVYRSASLHWA